MTDAEPAARRLIDLHTHSRFSDGRLSPEQVVRLADQQGLLAVSLTDHDTTAGLADARREARDRPGLTFIDGVELSARCATGTMHILGYAFDEAHPVLEGLLAELRDARARRNPQMLARLRELGLAIDMEDVQAVAASPDGPRGVVGRLHVAEALRRKGYVSSTQQAFARYIGKGQPAYIEKDHHRAAEVIVALHAAGGVAVLAHPVHLACRNAAQLETTIRDLVDHGLDGVEIYHSDHSDVEVRAYLRLARRFALGITGGSDFHGAAKPGVMLGRPRTPAAIVTGEFARRLGLG